MSEFINCPRTEGHFVFLPNIYFSKQYYNDILIFDQYLYVWVFLYERYIEEEFLVKFCAHLKGIVTVSI